MDASKAHSPSTVEFSHGLAGLGGLGAAPAAPAGDRAGMVEVDVRNGTAGDAGASGIGASIGGVAGAVRWLGAKPRASEVELQHPFAIGDVEVRVVTIRRLQAGEVDAFTDRMRESGRGMRFPMFFVGERAVTDEEWAALDDDDRFALTEASDAFLPARFKVSTAPPAA